MSCQKRDSSDILPYKSDGTRSDDSRVVTRVSKAIGNTFNVHSACVKILHIQTLLLFIIGVVNDDGRYSVEY